MPPSTTSRSEIFTLLRQMAQTLSLAWDLDTTLDLIARKTADLMQADSCTIYLLDPDHQILRLRASTGLAHRAVGRATLKVGEGMTGYAVQIGQPIHARDAQHNPHFKQVDEAEELDFQSLLAVPLMIEERPIGAMNVQTLDPHRFDDEEVEILSLIGDLAAGALAKAQLYDKQKQQIEEMRALAQVSEAITSPQYLDDMLHVVTDMAAQTLGAAVCSIFLLDETGTRLEMRSARRTTSPYRHRPPLAVGTGAIGHVAAVGVPLYIADVRTDARYLGHELAREEGLVSLLAVPLSVRDRMIGVLTCYTAVAHTFTPEQETLLLTLANQTALAIENARLVTNTAIVREMHHRIKNNLQTVAMLMQLQLPDAERLDTREVLQTNIHRIRSIASVHEVLSEKGFRLVDVKDVLERIMGMTAIPINPNTTIHIYGESVLLPSREATSLTLVVNELVQNALEHAHADQVNVSLGHSAEEIIVLVQDDGVGLPHEFELGLGLEIAGTLVREDLNGRLKFNRLEKGTEVSVRIPRTRET
jgi:signal transduction protein with GAF and PtsI domain